jgi:hypothetical protein
MLLPHFQRESKSLLHPSIVLIHQVLSKERTQAALEARLSPELDSAKDRAREG